MMPFDRTNFTGYTDNQIKYIRIGWNFAMKAMEPDAQQPAPAQPGDDVLLDLAREECANFRWPSTALSIMRKAIAASVAPAPAQPTPQEDPRDNDAYLNGKDRWRNEEDPAHAAHDLITAADKHADNYEGHDIPARDVRASICNAFYAGAKFHAVGVAPAPAPVRTLSDFIRNATDEEKEAVYLEVMDKVAARQRAVIEGAPAPQQADKETP